MKLRALCITLMILILSCPVTTAQVGDTTSVPTLYLYAEANRSVWFDLYLSEEPANPALISAALATMVEEHDLDVVEGYYDGFDDEEGASWSGYWADAMEGQRLLISGELELEPLRQALSAVGADTLAVEVYLPEAPHTEIDWSDEAVVLEGDMQWNSTALPLDKPLPRLILSFGFTLASLALWYVPPLLCGILLIGYALFLRYAALKRPIEEAGFACFACTRGSLYSIVGFWIALLFASRMWSPLLPLELAWGPQWVEWPWSLLREGALVAFATILSASVRIIVFPVYARYPDATWTRRDFVVQCLWGCALAAVIIMTFGALPHYLDESPARAVALTVMAAIVGIVVYWQLLYSMGLELQAIDEGELRERVDGLAALAGIPRINGVYLIYMRKTPILNAYAANNLRVLITDYLLRRLSRREVDAILAHEVSHLKRRHPERLRNIMALNFILFCYGSIALYLIGLAVLEQFVTLPYGATSTSSIVAAALPGVLAMQIIRMRYSRRFEREADDGALALTGDAEAQIASLTKLTRMNHMPLVWGGKWRERMITHPSTLARVRRIAAQGRVTPERVEELLAGAAAEGDSTLEADCYDCRGNTSRRLFNMEFKLKLIRLNGFVLLVLPAIGATAAMALWSMGVPPMPGWGALPLAVAVALGLCVLFQNRAAVRGYRDLARQMRAKSMEGLTGESGHFVTFAPSTDALLYDGFNNWDVGLLQFDSAGLHYRGDGTTFSLPREKVQTIELVSRPNFIIPSTEIYVTWLDSSESGRSRTFLFRAADASSLIAMNRESRRLHRSLREWQQAANEGSTGTQPQALPLPGKLDVKGQRVSDVSNGNRLLGSGLQHALCGFATAHAAGLPAIEPFASSAAGAAVATGCAVMLLMAPLWRFGRTHRAA